MFDVETISGEVKENSEFLPENQRFLERIEEDRLSKELSAKIIKNVLECFMFNSMNVFLCLYMINVGLGVILSAVCGFGVGVIPAVKNISENVSLSIEGDEKKFMGNGKVIRGVLGILTAAFLSYNAVSEMLMIESIARKSHEQHQLLIDKYEKDGKKGLDPNLLYVLLVGGGAFGAIFILGLVKKKLDDF